MLKWNDTDPELKRNLLNDGQQVSSVCLLYDPKDSIPTCVFLKLIGAEGSVEENLGAGEAMRD